MRPTALSRGLKKDPGDGEFERILGNASRLSLCLIGALGVMFALQVGQFVLAPVLLAITIGLMFGRWRICSKTAACPRGCRRRWWC
jgi:hypothetical protein